MIHTLVRPTNQWRLVCLALQRSSTIWASRAGAPDHRGHAMGGMLGLATPIT